VIPILETKAAKRNFSEHQKQLLWHSLAEKKCIHCGLQINGWNDVHVDHKRPYARGGSNKLANGQLLYAKCNQALGVKGL
jgi:5-methylcytosine-specific restriction endonuclease McrA